MGLQSFKNKHLKVMGKCIVICIEVVRYSYAIMVLTIGSSPLNNFFAPKKVSGSAHVNPY